MLRYLRRQLIQGNLNLALDVTNNISKHFQTILLHLSTEWMLLNDRERQPVMKVLDFGKLYLFTCRNLDMRLRDYPGYEVAPGPKF